jgi:hypothetical protein
LIFAKKLTDRSIPAPGQYRQRKNGDAEAIAQVRRIAEAYRWRNPDGEEVAFLSADELENLTIRFRHADRRRARHHQPPHRRHHPDARTTALAAAPEERPEYAGGHHERMDGKGYPRGLKREQMSWQAG